jgi:hypothetical protein
MRKVVRWLAGRTPVLRSNLIRGALCLFALAGLFAQIRSTAAPREQHLLYVGVPGIRDYLDWGGAGVLVFDIDHGHRFVKRIPTFATPANGKVEAVKGVCASARTGRMYICTTARMGCLDLVTEKMLWEKTYRGGCDRMAISPDGKVIYLPWLEGPNWHVVDAATGDVTSEVVTNSGSHNTVFGPDGREVYLAGLKSPLLSVADPATAKVTHTIGPFSNVIRPFTVNGKQTFCFVNVNELLGFEVGDLKSGKVLYQVEVKGFPKGPTLRHGCPAHGVGLTPDEKELWLSDAHNSTMHVFDATQMPPHQVADLKVRDQPGWVTFSIDGKYAYPSTGDVFEVKSKKLAAQLTDETGRHVASEKLLEIDFADGKPIRNGDQFGIGHKR